MDSKDISSSIRTFPGPGLKCPNCECTIQVPQLGSQWKEVADANKGCYVNGLDVNHNTVVVVPLSTDRKMVHTEWKNETRLTFTELFEKYVLVDHFPDEAPTMTKSTTMTRDKDCNWYSSTKSGGFCERYSEPTCGRLGCPSECDSFWSKAPQGKKLTKATVPMCTECGAEIFPLDSMYCPACGVLNHTVDLGLYVDEEE